MTPLRLEVRLAHLQSRSNRNPPLTYNIIFKWALQQHPFPYVADEFRVQNMKDYVHMHLGGRWHGVRSHFHGLSKGQVVCCHQPDYLCSHKVLRTFPTSLRHWNSLLIYTRLCVCSPSQTHLTRFPSFLYLLSSLIVIGIYATLLGMKEEHTNVSHQCICSPESSIIVTSPWSVESWFPLAMRKTNDAIQRQMYGRKKKSAQVECLLCIQSSLGLLTGHKATSHSHGATEERQCAPFTTWVLWF